MAPVYQVYDYKLNAALCKGRVVELGLTYDDVARRVAALSQRSVTPGYICHLINGRRRGEHLWPFLAQALDAPLAYLTDPHPRRIPAECEKKGKAHNE